MVDARITDHDKFILYRIDTFYVEIQYDSNTNKVIGLESSIILKNDYLNLN